MRGTLIFLIFATYVHAQEVNSWISMDSSNKYYYIATPDSITFYFTVKQYKNKKKTKGVWTCYKYLNTDTTKVLISEKEFKNDKLNGCYKVFHANNLLKRNGKYKNSKRMGKWKYFNENGQLEKDIKYRRSTNIKSIRQYYTNGNIKEKGKLAERYIKRMCGSELIPVHIGNWKYYDEEGKLKEVKKFGKKE